MGRVFDCFTFYNELDLLEIRLNELDPVVDRFILAEATRTYSDQPKRLYFQENRDRYSRFLDRITHIVVDDLPRGGETETDHFRRENYQRNALSRGLVDLQPDDYVIVSDLDEIIRAEAIRKILTRPPRLPTVHVFELRWFYYFINLERPSRWLAGGPRMVAMRYAASPQTIRSIRPPKTRPWPRRLHYMRRNYGRMIDFTVHRDAGWHFSYLGGIGAIANKLKTYAHIHPDFHMDPSHIAKSVAARRSYDPSDPDILQLRRIDASYPDYVRRNLDKFEPLIANQSCFAK